MVLELIIIIFFTSLIVAIISRKIIRHDAEKEIKDLKIENYRLKGVDIEEEEKRGGIGGFREFKEGFKEGFRKEKTGGQGKEKESTTYLRKNENDDDDPNAVFDADGKRIG